MPSSPGERVLDGIGGLEVEMDKTVIASTGVGVAQLLGRCCLPSPVG